MSSIFISGTLACLLTVKLEENLYVCLAKHNIQYKILTEPVGGFYMSPVSISYIIFCYLHNLFEHNTDYLMSYPTAWCFAAACPPATQTRLDMLEELCGLQD